MTQIRNRADAHAGDWLEASGIHGQPVRRGQIVEVLGESGHERYRVRWDDRHESIVFPADGVNIIPEDEARASMAG
jgi:Domain of unknown function (DUF1918)